MEGKQGEERWDVDLTVLPCCKVKSQSLGFLL